MFLQQKIYPFTVLTFHMLENISKLFQSRNSFAYLVAFLFTKIREKEKKKGNIVQQWLFLRNFVDPDDIS